MAGEGGVVTCLPACMVGQGRTCAAVGSTALTSPLSPLPFFLSRSSQVEGQDLLQRQLPPRCQRRQDIQQRRHWLHDQR